MKYLIRQWRMRAHRFQHSVVGSDPRLYFSLLLFLSFCSSYSLAEQPVGKRPVTVESSIATRRLVRLVTDPADAIRISPDGTRYLIVLTQGDLKDNGNWVEFLSGSLETLATAKPEVVARLFTTSTNPSPLLAHRIDWLDKSERVAFLWDSGKEPLHVVELNLRTREIAPLIRHPTDISNYSISADGKTVLFSAGSERSGAADEMILNGFAVPDHVILNDLLKGSVSGDPSWYQDVFVQSLADGQTRKLALPRRGVFVAPSFYQTRLYLSPDGRFAVVTAPPADIPKSWDSYEDPYLVSKLGAFRDHPEEPSEIVQYWLVDVQRAAVRPLWNAPNLIGWSEVAWSPDSRKVAIGPTFLPLGESASHAARTGVSVAVVDVMTGHVDELKMPATFNPRRTIPVTWVGQTELLLPGRSSARPEITQHLRFRASGENQWALAAAEDHVEATPGTGVRLEWRQDLNSPPELYGVDTKTGKSRLLLETNPELRTDFRLGRVEQVSWKSKDGRAWTGWLYYPVNYSVARRFPLLIKGGYHTPAGQFSLVGDEENMTAGGAQALANRDIATLLADVPDDGMPSERSTPREFEIIVAGYEAAIDHFVQTGLVDREKIGVMGVSRFGDRAAHFITQSTYPVAAALLADNLDDGYLQYLEWGAQVRAGIAMDIGKEPVADGFKAWLDRAPGFNVDKIHAPVRLERDSRGLVGAVDSWEMFSQLRYLKRPVELYFIPDIAHGTHALVSPRQLCIPRGGGGLV